MVAKQLRSDSLVENKRDGSIVGTLGCFLIVRVVLVGGLTIESIESIENSFGRTLRCRAQSDRPAAGARAPGSD